MLVAASATGLAFLFFSDRLAKHSTTAGALGFVTACGAVAAAWGALEARMARQSSASVGVASGREPASISKDEPGAKTPLSLSSLSAYITVDPKQGNVLFISNTSNVLLEDVEIFASGGLVDSKGRPYSSVIGQDLKARGSIAFPVWIRGEVIVPHNRTHWKLESDRRNEQTRPEQETDEVMYSIELGPDLRSRIAQAKDLLQGLMDTADSEKSDARRESRERLDTEKLRALPFRAGSVDVSLRVSTSGERITGTIPVKVV